MMGSIFLVCLLLGTFDGTASTKMHNIGYMFKGYDILKGNPMNVDGLPIDPGFRQAIFKGSYSFNKQTPDRRYEVPDGTYITDCTGTCSLAFGSKLISGTKAYSKSLQRKVSVGGGWGAAAFSASVDYKEVEEKTSKNENFFTHSDASCCAYIAQTTTYSPPPLSKNFIQAVKALPQNYEKYEYQKFIRVFGTHYITKAYMGSLFGQQSQLSKAEWTTMKEKGLDIGASASYSAGAISVSAEVQTSDQKKEAETFKENTSNQKTYTIGALPPADGKMMTWVQASKENPAPMSLRLTSIVELLEVPAYKQLSSKKVRENLQKTVDNYCNYLHERGEVKTCEAPKPDPPFPKTRVWSKWSNGNTRGSIRGVCECAEGQYVTETLWEEQWGYGFINLSLKCSNGKTCASTNKWNSASKRRTCKLGFRQMTGREESGYGIMNAKSFCYNSQIQQTYGGNFNGKYNGDLKCDGNQKIVGYQARQQSGYGIINFRILCA